MMKPEAERHTDQAAWVRGKSSPGAIPTREDYLASEEERGSRSIAIWAERAHIDRPIDVADDLWVVYRAAQWRLDHPWLAWLGDTLKALRAKFT